jgi:hypothetical protein
MKKIFLLLLIFCATQKSTFAIKLQDALKQNLVKIEQIEAIGDYKGKAIACMVVNQQKKHIRLEIPYGTIFDPENPTRQPIVTTESEAITMSPLQRHRFELIGYCCDAPKMSPFKGDIFKLSDKNNEKLLKTIQCIQREKIVDKSEIQNAIWAVSNEHRAEAIEDEELKTFVATTTGQTLRPVKIIYDQSNHPGQAAFADNTLKVRGLFKYTTEKDIIANLGLYDSTGKLVKMLQPKLQHQRGMHKFGFNFEMKNVKHGQYAIKLTSGDMVLNEMAVDF